MSESFTDIVHAPAEDAWAALPPPDRARLAAAAAAMLEARTPLIWAADAVGHAVAETGNIATNLLRRKLNIDLRAKSQEIVTSLLWGLQAGSLVGIEDEAGGAGGARRARLYKVAAVTSGAVGGFLGAPGLLFDLPVTTTLILRTIAEVAREFPGESLASEDTRRACIAVFSLGSPELGSPEGGPDDAESGYWNARMAIEHTAIGLVIRNVASRVGVRLSEKLLAQAIPIVGSFASAGLNYAFMDYYRRMAGVHFAIRAVERSAADPAAVRACFARAVREARVQRRLKRR